MREPYFSAAIPKSTGREYFNLAWVQTRHPDLMQIPAADVQATFLELSARTVADAVQRHAPSSSDLVVCGGGARNPALLDRIRECTGLAVLTSDSLGYPSQQIEAAAFAWLAQQRLAGRPGNAPSVTGAKRPAVLGAIYQP